MIRFAQIIAVATGIFLLVQIVPAQEIVPPLDEAEQAQPILPPDNEIEVVESVETLDRLFEQLRKDPKATTASATAKMIWREWLHSGSASIDLLIRWAGSAMGKEEFAKAEDLLDQVTVLAPDYAEGWNRRATLYYHKKDFGRSLADIETTLALEPRHFGALSGLAAIMQQTGNDKAALKTWYKVLQIYPANPQAQTSVISLEEKRSGNRT